VLDLQSTSEECARLCTFSLAQPGFNLHSEMAPTFPPRTCVFGFFRLRVQIFRRCANDFQSNFVHRYTKDIKIHTNTRQMHVKYARSDVLCIGPPPEVRDGVSRRWAGLDGQRAAVDDPEAVFTQPQTGT
jgi:hypothetical protein